ncbi:unnamed protein product [Notodromas monacha]|uniref:Uncharacterized protein n=1 Tax=Notodromas monacha TaxID=399045 RepID=A0A7R9GA42_9CRUS|nr:unnamed protein product [Notodromas monacha]CAG0914935.1 unnamed protein product [Notodromas monacha]
MAGLILPTSSSHDRTVVSNVDSTFPGIGNGERNLRDQRAQREFPERIEQSELYMKVVMEKGIEMPETRTLKSRHYILNQLKDLNSLNAATQDPVPLTPSPSQAASPSAALINAFGQTAPEAATDFSNFLSQQGFPPAAPGSARTGKSPFDTIPGLTEPTAQKADPEARNKPFVFARCRDCNIALGEKEIMNFLQDLVEMMNQPGQNFFTHSSGKRAFDGECINCNLLVGGTEAMTAAAQSMFSSLKSPKSHHTFK